MTLTVLALSLVLTSVAAAQQTRVYRDGNTWVEETTGSLPAVPNMKVVTDLGNVNVTGGAGQITYTIRKRAYTGSEQRAREEFAEFRVSATRQADTALISGSGPGARRFSAEFNVQVPRATQQARIMTHGGNVSAHGLDGKLWVSTGGGNVSADDVRGAVSIQSGGGNVSVGKVASDVTVRTGGGNVSIKAASGRVVTESGGGNIMVGSSAAGVVVNTGGGMIDVQECRGELKAQTGGGNLALGNIMGRASLQSGGGSIRLANASGPVIAQTGGGNIELFGLSQGAQVETGAGGIVAEFVGQNFTGSNLETPAGDITIYLSPNLKATVRAVIDMASGHSIRSEFADIKVRTEGGTYGPKTVYAEGSLNGGGPILNVRAVNGDIEIRRAKK